MRSEGGLKGYSRTMFRLRIGKPVSMPMSRFCYVYILESELDAQHFYIGSTGDLKQRLAKHNAGGVSHTAKFKPWRIKSAIAFTDQDRAAQFERYLKSGSGRAFAKKHL